MMVFICSSISILPVFKNVPATEASSKFAAENWAEARWGATMAHMWLALFLFAAEGRAPPAGFVDASKIAGVRIHIGYATAENFTGAPLPGYAAAGAWLLAPAAEALAKV